MKGKDEVEAKKAYVEKTRTRLGEMETQIEELMTQATRSEYDEYFSEIRTKQESAKARLEELEGASEEAWQDLRVPLDKAVNDVQNALFVVTAHSGQEAHLVS